LAVGIYLPHQKKVPRVEGHKTMANTNDVCARLNSYANSHVWSKSASVRERAGAPSWSRTIGKSCTISLYVRTPSPSHPCVSLMSNSRFIGEHVCSTRSRRTMFRACTPCSLVFVRGVSDPDGPVRSRRAGQRKRRGRARMTYVVHVMWFSREARARPSPSPSRYSEAATPHPLVNGRRFLGANES
jgi:hypothetical protein